MRWLTAVFLVALALPATHAQRSFFAWLFNKSDDQKAKSTDTPCARAECPRNTKCVLKSGQEDGFVCQPSCQTGHLLVDGDCIDADECLLEAHHCHRNARCVNTNGSFTCECMQGYKGLDRFGCINIDECKEGTHKCAENSICTDKDGGYRCKCEDGFVGSGMTNCKDIDECVYAHLSTCPNSTRCVNTAGSYHCECAAGFTGYTQAGCTDIDECNTQLSRAEPTAEVIPFDFIFDRDQTENLKQGLCPRNTVCLNSLGSYDCQCADGYTSNKLEENGGCLDVNECSSKSDHWCHKHADCQNTPGSYTCICESGYSGNGTHCEAFADCHVSNWHAWTRCKYPCNKKTNRERKRQILTLSSGGGKKCPSLRETVDCPMTHCVYWYDYERTAFPGQPLNSSTIPIYVNTGYHKGDCAVTRWSTWSSCHCRTQRQRRRRKLLHKPSGGGRACPTMKDWKQCTSASSCKTS